MLGRWESSAYQLYLYTPREELASVSSVLAATVIQHSPFVSLLSHACLFTATAVGYGYVIPHAYVWNCSMFIDIMIVCIPVLVCWVSSISVELCQLVCKGYIADSMCMSRFLNFLIVFGAPKVPYIVYAFRYLYGFMLVYVFI